MYYIGLDVHKKTISYCVKDASGQVHREGQIGATRRELESRARSQERLTWPGGAKGTVGATAHNELTGKLLGLL